MSKRMPRDEWRDEEWGFTPVRPLRASEEVARQIRQQILAGRLRPGDRLPPQRRLTELFGVSRSAVLDGLRSLEREGLLVVRPGAAGGAFVADATPRAVTEALGLTLALGRVSVEHLAQFRILVEGGTAAWAAERATEEQIERLRAIARRLHEMAAASYPWVPFFYQDIEFHLAVAEASGNPVALWVLRALADVLRGAFMAITPGLYERVVSDIQGILEAIEARDPELAAARMRAHISYFAEDMLHNLQRDGHNGLPLLS
ncbi:MAG TPA: FadR/GntR family transcriptional regulator [Chloroflexota bacterium]